MSNIDKTTPMEELTIGGNIYEAGNAREFICFVGGFELSLRNKDLCIFLRHYRN